MREIPITMSAGNVTRLFKGAKTQTRRPFHVGLHDETQCPYGDPGDVLWVKEPYWRLYERVEIQAGTSGRRRYKHVPVPGTPIHYDANGPRQRTEEESLKRHVWRLVQPRFMSKAESRLRLRVAGHKLERLHDISEADAKAEGVTPGGGLLGTARLYRYAYMLLWNSIYGTDAWDQNPLVWAVTFTPLLPA